MLIASGTPQVLARDAAQDALLAQAIAARQQPLPGAPYQSIGVAPDDDLYRALTAPTASGANPPYPANHTFDDDIRLVGAPPTNHDFETLGSPNGTPPSNFDLEASAQPAGTPPTNHDFATGDLTGWTTSGTASIASDTPHGAYAQLGSSGVAMTDAFTVDTTTQAISVEIGFLTTSGLSAVNVYARSGSGYTTSTSLGLLSCTACNAWQTRYLDLSAFLGQSIKLRFERVGGTIGVDAPRGEVFLPDTIVSGPVSRVDEANGNSAARLSAGSAALTTASFTVDAATQTLSVRVRDNGANGQFYGYVLSGAGFATQTQVIVKTSIADDWETVAFNATPWQGQTIKLKIARQYASFDVDDLGQQRVEFPGWTIADGDAWPETEDGNTYIVASNGTDVISDAFTLDAAAQNLTLRYRGETASATFYPQLLRGPDFSEVVPLTGAYVVGASVVDWTTLTLGVSLQAGETVKLRMRAYLGRMQYDDIGVVSAVMPSWTATTNTPLAAGSDSHGSWVRAATGSVIVRSSDVSPGILDPDSYAQMRYYAISYDIGYATSEMARVWWIDRTTGDKWVVFQDASSSPTGYRTRYFSVIDVMGVDGYFEVQLPAKGKVYSIADNVARQHLNEPFSNTVGVKIDTSTGSFGYEVQDLATAGTMPLVFTRYYAGHSDQYGSLGYRWSHSYDTRLVIDASGDAGIIYGSGKAEFYEWQSAWNAYRGADARIHNTLVKNADGSYTFTTTANLTYQFTADGVLNSISDLNGNATTLSYDGSGRLATVADPDGRALTFAYDGNGRLASLTDPAGRVVSYAYDAAGDLTIVTDVDSKLWTYVYDKHRLVSVTDPDSQVLFSNTFDSAHRVIEQVDALGNPLTIDYDTPAKGVTSVTDREAQTARYHYDRYGRTTDRVDPLGRVITNLYDANGNLETIIDPANNAWEFAYDASGNLTGTTDPLGNPASIAYNAQHLPRTVTDARGNTTTYTYDSNGNVLTKTDPLNHTWTYTYDADGHLLTETDPLNHTWTHAYDASGNRQTLTDPLNRVTTYTSDFLGRVTSVTNPAGETTEYGYSVVGKVNRETNALDDSKQWTYNFWGQVTSAEDETGNQNVYLYDEVGNLASIVDPANQTTTFTFDANGNRLTATDPLDRTTTYAYDEHDRVISITDPLNQTTAYTYDDAGRLATETDPLGRVTSYSYNATGQVTSKVLPNLGIWTYTYDANGNLLTETDPLNQTTSYTYDANNRRVSMTDARNGTTTSIYDAAGRLTSITDPLNQTTSFTYDAVGNLLTRTDALNHAWTYAYDDADRLISVTNPLNQTTTRVYDDVGRVISVTDPLNQTTSYAYDAAGRRTSVTTPTGGVTSYAYDPRGLLTSVTDPLNHATTYAYDDAGQRTSFTNRRNATTSYGYDLAGRMTTMTDALAGVVTMGYDAAGQMISLTNPNGKTTTYAYDALSNQTSVTDPLNRTQTSTYDLLGQLTSTSDARNVTVGYGYDAVGNQTTTTYPGGSITQTYDAANQRTTMTDATGTTTWTYDANGQVTAVAAPNGTTSYSYDAAGRRSEMELPGNRVYTYTHDAVGRTETVSDWLSQTISFGYDASGRRTSITRPNGITSTYAYDAAGQVTAIDHAGTGLGSTQSFAYTYDAEGNRTSMTSNAGTETYTLDALNRLTNVTNANGDTVAYTYDATGNRLTEAVNGTTTHTYTYDDADQLTSDGTDSYTYDAAGNTLTAGSDSYTWDWANRLTGATVNGVSTTYSYDGDDTRTSATTGGNTSAYLWDRLGDVDLLIDDGAHVYLHEGGVLSEIDAGGDTTYGMSDGLGSVRGLTDETGSLTGSASYDAFGNVTSQTGTTSTFGYSGEQTDPTGDLYLRARTYDAETGRFLSADPVQPNAPGTQGYNRYAYVANNPTTWADPTGHQVAGTMQPVLNPNWLPIGIALGMEYVAAACAAFPPRCFTALGALGLFAIIIFAIIACVLEVGGPCWLLRALPDVGAPPFDNIIPFKPRHEKYPPRDYVDPIPPINPWPDEQPQRRKTCESEFPNLPRCEDLGPDYIYGDAYEALDAVKKRARNESLSFGKEDPADKGPCGRDNDFGYDQGTHIEVNDGNRYRASIGECPCCSMSSGKPHEDTRCAIVAFYD